MLNPRFLSDQSFLLDKKDAAKYLLKNLQASHLQLPTYKVGRRHMIDVLDINDFLDLIVDHAKCIYGLSAYVHEFIETQTTTEG